MSARLTGWLSAVLATLITLALVAGELHEIGGMMPEVDAYGTAVIAGAVSFASKLAAHGWQAWPWCSWADSPHWPMLIARTGFSECHRQRPGRASPHSVSFGGFEFSLRPLAREWPANPAAAR